MSVLARRCVVLFSLCLAVLADSPVVATAAAVQHYKLLGTDLLQRLSSLDLNGKYSFRIHCPYNEKMACIDNFQRDIARFNGRKGDVVFDKCTQTSLTNCVKISLDAGICVHDMQVYWRRSAGSKPNIWLLEVSDGCAPGLMRAPSLKQ